MMKKLLILTAAAAAALCAQPLTALAVTEYSDGVYTFVKTPYDTALLTDCALTGPQIEVPELVLGYPVAGVGDYAFMGRSDVQTILLPDSVSAVGEYAFAESGSLELVAVPRYCESIADNAFFNSPHVTLACYFDTKAYAYANEKGMPVRLLDKVTAGDADGSGSVTIEDVTAIQRAVAELTELGGLNAKAADINGDGDVNIDDATALQMYLAEYETAYPIGERV